MYTIVEASEKTKLDSQKISQLIHTGTMVPEHHRSSGPGDPSILGDKNLRELKLVYQLAKLEVRGYAVQSILRTLNTSVVHWHEKENVTLVILDRNRWFLTDNVYSEPNKQIIAEENGAIIINL